jgi:anti-sigma-K factor RskA
MTEDDDLLAAEYALGLLSADDARVAEARLRADAALSLRVAWWRDQLAPLADEVSVAPRPQLWDAIAARLPVNDDARDAARPWKWATGALGAVAAALLAVVALRPDAAPPPPGPVPTAPLVASLSGADGAAVTISYDAASGRMLVAPLVLDAGAGDAELWIIPAGSTEAVSMGVIDTRAPAMHETPVEKRPMLGPGATFAISIEARGGSPTGRAQGPIVASGKIVTT